MNSALTLLFILEAETLQLVSRIFLEIFMAIKKHKQLEQQIFATWGQLIDTHFPFFHIILWQKLSADLISPNYGVNPIIKSINDVFEDIYDYE